MGIFKIKRDEHRVIETGFACFLRRHLRDNALFTAYNIKAKRWFLGLWLNKDRGVAQDVDDLGVHMELATRDLVMGLERSREGITAADMRKSLLRCDKNRYVAECEAAEERQEVQDWLQKKTGSELPVLMG